MVSFCCWSEAVAVSGCLSAPEPALGLGGHLGAGPLSVQPLACESHSPACSALGPQAGHPQAHLTCASVRPSQSQAGSRWRPYIGPRTWPLILTYQPELKKGVSGLFFNQLAMKQPLNRVKRQKSEHKSISHRLEQDGQNTHLLSPYQNPPKTEFKTTESTLSQETGATESEAQTSG